MPSKLPSLRPENELHLKKIFVKEGPSLKVKLPNTYTCPKMKINGKKPSKFQFHFPGLLEACPCGL